jgi:hypothetical protein
MIVDDLVGQDTVTVSKLTMGGETISQSQFPIYHKGKVAGMLNIESKIARHPAMTEEEFLITQRISKDKVKGTSARHSR